jgi:hypothetical protein
MAERLLAVQNGAEGYAVVTADSDLFHRGVPLV